LHFAQNNAKSGTCIQLTVFIKLVQAELQVGQVSSVQATQLIQGAQNIQAALGCTVASSPNGIGPLSASPSPPSLNMTQSQQKQPQTGASSPSLLQPQSQSPYPYSNQYRYPSQYPQSQQLPPIANAGISQTVNENTKVTLDGRASYSPTGGIVVAYQWTQLTSGEPVILTGANTATPAFTPPMLPTDTGLEFSLRVLDNHGAVSTNSSVVHIMVRHNFNIGPAGGNTLSSIVTTTATATNSP